MTLQVALIIVIISFLEIGLAVWQYIRIKDCEEQVRQIHKLPEDPPTSQGFYLTRITIKKTISDMTEIRSRWEVLYFNPEMKVIPKWNTMHLEDWEVTITHWQLLPLEP